MKHSYHDVIVAWAAGKQVQYRYSNEGEWTDTGRPSFEPSLQWRIKPEIRHIKYKRWVYNTGSKIGVDVADFSSHYNPETDSSFFVKWIDEDWIHYEVEI